MRINAIFIWVLLCLVSAQVAAGELLIITENKSHVLRLPRPGTTVMIADPSVADVQVEGPQLIFILGRAVGETNLTILDRDGREIVAYDLVVAPEVKRHVTIYRSTASESTLSCVNKRCTALGDGGGAAPAAAGAAADGAGANAAATLPAATGTNGAASPTEAETASGAATQ